MLKRSVYRIALLVVVVTALVGLPIAAGAQSANGITSVKDGATVSGKVEIKGNANDPNFSRWQLDLLPDNKADAAIFLVTDAKSGPFSYTLDTTRHPNGDHALRLRVVRSDGNYDEYITKMTIANLAAKSIVASPTPTPTAMLTTTVATTTTITTSATPVTTAVAITPTAATTSITTTNGITSIQSGATVAGAVAVKGNANDPSFSKWQLDLLPDADPNAPVFLALDTKPGQFSYVLNTIVWPNGKHALRLRVVRPDGNYDEYVTPFSIANPLALAVDTVSKPAGNIRGD